MPTVLHVDDETYILRITEWTLRRQYTVLTAGSGEEALEILEREPVDVVISDMRMPGMSGLEVLQRAKELQPRAARILATAYTTHEDTVKAVQEVGVFKVLSKPWEPEELMRLIEEACRAVAGD